MRHFTSFDIELEKLISALKKSFEETTQKEALQELLSQQDFWQQLS